MSKIAKKLTDLIGNTPLLELSNFNKKYALPSSASWNISIRAAASKTASHWQ